MTPRTRDSLAWAAVLIVAAIAVVVGAWYCVKVYLGAGA